MLSSVRGVEIHLHTSHSILLFPVLYWKRRIERPLQSMTGRGTHSHLEGCVIVYCNNKTEELHDEVLEIFFAGNTKETVSP